MVAIEHHPPEVIVELNEAGQVLRRYARGRFLGKGGFARVYEATNIDTGTLHAVKVIDKQMLQKPKTQAKLRSEIKIHSSLRHKYVVQFERFFEDPQNVYIILELCTQQTLMELQRRKKQLSEQEAQYVMLQTIDAVKYLHAKSVIHRDLKLGNVFLSENMDIKIGDFGLAAEVEFGERKRTLCGTPNYIAPEILDGKHGHSFEVDIWCLGVILYTLLVGRPPFETADVKSTYKRIRDVNYTFPESLHVSLQARHLIRRILQSQPENRPSLADIEADPFFHTAPQDLMLHAPWSLFAPTHPQYNLRREALAAAVGEHVVNQRCVVAYDQRDNSYFSFFVVPGTLYCGQRPLGGLSMGGRKGPQKLHHLEGLPTRSGEALGPQRNPAGEGRWLRREFAERRAAFALADGRYHGTSSAPSQLIPCVNFVHRS